MARAIGRWLGLLALLLGAGCEPEDDLVTADEAEARDNLALFQEAGPTSYTYTLQRNCHCPFTGEWSRIVVEDGVVQSALTAEGEDTGGGTMPEVLEGVIDWTKRDPLELEVRYEADLGYLLHLELDLSDASDDEYELTVDCFGEGTGEDVCPLEP